MSTNINGISGVNFSNIQSLDLETALMAVQSQRAQLLEGQLQSQLKDVQARNDSIGKLNTALSAARTLSGNINTADSKKGPQPSDGIDKNSQSYKDLKSAAEQCGQSLDGIDNRGQLDKFLENLKSGIDSQSNSQQMEMLRLQSLSNKRNESFDVMTNFIKKMQESRSSIIGNMR